MGKGRQNSAVDVLVERIVGLTRSQPRVSRDSSGIRIEFDVTPDATRQWQQVLALLEQGTAFGMTDTEEAQVAWVRMPPEANDDDPAAR
ncbi:hypothetical protein [Streptomyces sp. SID12501]|uniref:DUF1654 domain-containing protein n=1 Tax=Streptomyces sp. SID12501 TaxID=2706042 RepID=A0A6B3BUV2_9ACTN|nr:hypothetical protein [Streptomyces sp. SID12501]NEC88070.1 hypothetical protein [Streptomyces sp. SID12501]